MANIVLLQGGCGGGGGGGGLYLQNFIETGTCGDWCVCLMWASHHITVRWPSCTYLFFVEENIGERNVYTLTVDL